MRSLTLAAILLATPAAAQQHPPCGDIHVIAAGLKHTFGEVPVSRGVTGNGSLIIIYATPSGSTWTAIQASPAGPACVIGSGASWEALVQPGAPA